MRTNLAPELLLTCLGLITVGLLTILSHGNEEQHGTGPGTVHRKQSLSSTTYPLPGPVTPQQQIPDQNNDNLYAPSGYLPEPLELSLFSSLEQHQSIPLEDITIPAKESSTNDDSMSIEEPNRKESRSLDLPIAGLNTSLPAEVENPYLRSWDSDKYYYNPPRALQDYSTMKRFQNTPADTMRYRFPEEPKRPVYPRASDSAYGYPEHSYNPPRNVRPAPPKRRNIWRRSDSDYQMD